MATSKVKGTNKKIKELKGIKPEKITDEELKRVQAAINNINRIQLEIGNLESKKHEMLHGASTFREELGLLQAQFQKDYGTFDVNIQDGTINYTKENGKVNKED